MQQRLQDIIYQSSLHATFVKNTPLCTLRSALARRQLDSKLLKVAISAVISSRSHSSRRGN